MTASLLLLPGVVVAGFAMLLATTVLEGLIGPPGSNGPAGAHRSSAGRIGKTGGGFGRRATVVGTHDTVVRERETR